MHVYHINSRRSHLCGIDRENHQVLRRLREVRIPEYLYEVNVWIRCFEDREGSLPLGPSRDAGGGAGVESAVVSSQSADPERSQRSDAVPLGLLCVEGQSSEAPLHHRLGSSFCFTGQLGFCSQGKGLVGGA